MVHITLRELSHPQNILHIFLPVALTRRLLLAGSAFARIHPGRSTPLAALPVVCTELLPTLERLCVHMCAGTAQPALVAVSCPARTLLTVMVTEQTAISKWRRLVVAQAAVHFAWTEGEFFGACCAHDGRVVVSHVRRAEASAVPERCGLPVLRGPSQATSASGQGGALAPPLSIKMLFSSQASQKL